MIRLHRPRKLIDIAQAEEMRSPRGRIHHAHSLAAVRIGLNELRLGRTFLERWPIANLHPENDWRSTHYVSNAPATFILRDVIVHSSAGLIQVDDEIVAESIAFSEPAANGYTVHPDGVVLHSSRTTSLPGTHITTLSGLGRNHYHAMVDGVARLAMVPPSLLETARSVLYAGTAAQDFALDKATSPVSLHKRAVATDEAFHVDTLILPLSLHHNGAFHPCLSDFCDRISASIPNDDPALPRRFYVDRRGSPARPLLNEAEVIERLLPLGFTPVRPETLSFPQQLRLFRNAEAIVAPHGAALTNLLWCRPGCAVLELQMDAYAHWFFRNLAGLRSLEYDCIFGRTLDPWPAHPSQTQALRWTISADHGAAAAANLL